MKKFIFFYFNSQLEKIRETVPSHIGYWNSHKFEYYKGGPFVDKTGGMIIFTADNPAQANKIISKDPFMIENLIAEYHLKEWI